MSALAASLPLTRSLWLWSKLPCLGLDTGLSALRLGGEAKDQAGISAYHQAQASYTVKSPLYFFSIPGGTLFMIETVRN